MIVEVANDGGGHWGVMASIGVGDGRVSVVGLQQ